MILSADVADTRLVFDLKALLMILKCHTRNVGKNMTRKDFFQCRSAIPQRAVRVSGRQSSVALLLDPARPGAAGDSTA